MPRRKWLGHVALGERWQRVGTPFVFYREDGKIVRHETVWHTAKRKMRFYEDGTTNVPGSVWRILTVANRRDYTSSEDVFRRSFPPQRLNPSRLLLVVRRLWAKAMEVQNEVSSWSEKLHRRAPEATIPDPDRDGRFVHVHIHSPSGGTIWWPSDNCLAEADVDAVECLGTSSPFGQEFSSLVQRKRYADRCWSRWSAAVGNLELVVAQHLPWADAATVIIDGQPTFWKMTGYDHGRVTTTFNNGYRWSLQEPSIAYVELDAEGNKVDPGPGRAVITWEKEA